VAVDRMRMSQQHEAAAAALVGGERSPGSGNQWKGPADGRSSRIKNEYGWVLECKATCGQGIEITRRIIDKLAGQAEGERPLILMRWYADESLEGVSHDLAAMTWADFREVMDDNASLRERLAQAESKLAQADAAAEQVQAGARLSPGTAAHLVRRAQEEAASLRREKELLESLVSTLGLLTPAQRELGSLGMPPRDLWPCTVIDVRKHDEPFRSGLRKRVFEIGADGRVAKWDVEPLAVRVDRGVGTKARLFLNDRIVRRGELRVNGILQVQVRDGDNYQSPPPPPADGVADTTA
jgi:hypothetical protein